MKVLTIYSVGDFYRNNKIHLVKLFKETIPGIGLKSAKDIADDLLFHSFDGVPYPIKLDNINENDFASSVHPTLFYTIGNNPVSDVKEEPCKVIESLKLTTRDITIIVQQNEQLKQENHELTKEIRSLKSTLYRTAVDLNKHYQATSNLMNYSGPRAAHIIKDLANDIRENGDTSEATKDC